MACELQLSQPDGFSWKGEAQQDLKSWVLEGRGGEMGTVAGAAGLALLA